MPESPRWLIAHNRRHEAKVLIDKASKKNSNATATVATIIQDQEFKDSNDLVMTVTTNQNSVKEKLRKNMKGFGVLITNSELRKRVLITNFIWMVASLCYYALGTPQ